MEYILGIDYGTANTVAAYIAKGEKETFIASPSEANTTQGLVFPSYVEYDQSGQAVNVGKKAWERAMGGSNTVVWGSKRLIGLPFEEAKSELRYLHYAIEKSPNGGVQIIVGPKRVTPADIASLILEKVRRDVENPLVNTLSGKIVKVVITHPANFDDERVKLIKESAQKAFTGIEVKTVTEPEATAMSYGIQFRPDKPEKVAVIDIGAGTLDVVVAMVGIDKNGHVHMSPGASRGKANLGGLDIDELIMDWVIDKSGFTELNNLRGMDKFSRDPASLQLLNDLQRLRRMVEDIKISISRTHKPQSIKVSCQGRFCDLTLTEAQLSNEILGKPLNKKRLENILGKFPNPEELTEMRAVLRRISPDRPIGDEVLPSFLDVFQIVIMNSISLAGSTPENIQHAILVGGPMYMPCIRTNVMEIFRHNPHIADDLIKIDREGFPPRLNPMQCVARGAALCGLSKTLTPIPVDYIIPFRKSTQRPMPSKPVYLCDKEEGKFLCIGDVQGKEKSVTRTESLGGGKIDVEVTLLSGIQETGISADPERRLWRRKGYYYFYPAYDSRGQAEYSMTLRYDEDGISCVCYDHISKKSFIYRNLNQLDGGEVDLKWIDRGNIDELTKVLIGQLDLFVPNVNIKVEVWLKQQHTPEKEKHRAEIEYLKGILAEAYAEAPKSQTIQWEKNEMGELITRDPQVISAWSTVATNAIELDSLISEDIVTGFDIDTVRNRAQYLFITAGEIDSNPDINEDKKRIIRDGIKSLESALQGLPDSINPKSSYSWQDVIAYKEVKNCCEILRNLIESALGEKLPD